MFRERKRYVAFVFCFVLFFLLTSSVFVFGKPDTKAPPDLKKWEEWVMYGNEKYACPSFYNDFHEFKCIWPELLNLDFTSAGGTFKQMVTAMIDSWFYLPGNNNFWPVSVAIDGEKVPVLLHRNKPAVRIQAGRHKISGEFKWTEVPQSFVIPEMTGLVALRVNNKVVNEPFIDKAGKLWIQKKVKNETGALGRESNIINVQIFRLIEDSVPLRLKTVIRLTVSGENRREKLISCLPVNMMTVSVKTPLPLKLGEDGVLQVDVRPGKWNIHLMSISDDPDYRFMPATAPYGEELWAYKQYPDLRVARIEGVEPVDPAQSRLPPVWKNYSTYRVRKGNLLSIKEIQRGTPEATADALFLKREFWLDFDGNGATVKDEVSGIAGKRLFFSMENDAYELGRVKMDSEDKLVTLKNGRRGIEVERGQVNLMAVSRGKKNVTDSPVSLGWKSRFKSVDGLFHLPPGWRLLAFQGGTAQYKSTWIDSWTLLDFFLILIVAFAVVKLFGWLWGGLFFTGLIVIAHEPGAPFYMWIVISFTTAIFNVLSSGEQNGKGGFLFRVVRFVHYSTMIILAVISFIFIAGQAKIMLYPQLEKVSARKSYSQAIEADTFASVEESEKVSVPQRRLSKKELLRDMAGSKRPDGSYGEQQKYQVAQQGMVTQTGPGIPAWDWRKVQVKLGAVSEEHKIKLWLLSPFQNSIFSAFRILFLLLMLYRFSNIRLSPFLRKKQAGSKVITALILMILFIPAAQGISAEMPANDLLLELEKRLIKPPECFPNCAVISDAKIYLPDSDSFKDKKQFIEIVLSISADVETAVPLPSGNGKWQLYDLVNDGKPHLAVISDKKTLWTYIPEGVHTLKIRGIAFNKKQFQFLFPLKPRYVETYSDGWAVTGINGNHQAENVIQASVIEPVEASKDSGADDGNKNELITEYLRVKRTFVLDFEWSVITTVERIVRSQDQQGVVADIPLLDNELVRTDHPAISITNSVATVSMSSRENKIEWQSSIPISSELRLKSVKGVRLTEVWGLRQSSMWHSTFEGIPVIYPEDSVGSFWYPWPGEELLLKISRLEPAPGQSMTIDSVRADYHIGKGYNRLLLKARIRTTSGRTHHIISPENTFVEHIRLNGTSFPLSGNSEKISLPVQPGTQDIEIEWNESQKWSDSWLKSFFFPKKIQFPELNVGSYLNNIDVYIHLPDKLWLLWTCGPRLGPAVLAWSLVVAILLYSIIAGRMNLSPLKSRQWLILGLGLVSLSVPEMLLVAGWFFVIEARKNKAASSPVLFNLIQMLLIAWTVFTVVVCLKAVSNGLIGIPDMQISGNLSSENKLHWTLDHNDNLLPRPSVWIYSIYIYQLVMLAWALWFSMGVIKWSKMCIDSLKSETFWKDMGLFKKKKKESGRDSI